MQGGMMGMINLGDIFGKGFGQKKEKKEIDSERIIRLLVK